MKVAIVQFDNRPFDEMGLMPFLLQRNKAYAARHGYHYRFVSAQSVDVPVYWFKPHLVAQYLEAGYDAVAWIDTDAVFHDLDRRIEPLFETGEAMIAAGDNPFWASPFNAGVFFVAGAAGLALMKRWAALFADTGWRRTEAGWVCEGEWAGSDYEQGAFVDRLLDDRLVAGDLRLVDWRVLQGPFPVAESFTLHFAGPFKRNLPAYLDMIAE